MNPSVLRRSPPATRSVACSTLALFVALAACQRSTANTSAPRSEAPNRGGGDQQIVVGPDGLGGAQVNAGGHPAWPPQGPGCERLVACCQAASSAAPDIGMFCQMSVAMPPVDCARALNEVRNYLDGRGAQTPAACGTTAQAEPSGTPAPPALPTMPLPPSATEPVTCATDADCGPLACGPCQSGTVVTRFSRSINCVRNPCPGTTAVCRNGVCVVR